MPQSLARLLVHLIYSTNHRRPVLQDSFRDSLHRYLSTVLQSMDCPPGLINSVEDPVHILFELGRSVAASHAVQEVKQTSSLWIKTQDKAHSTFTWQARYGAFAVSESPVASVRDYIANQKEHHRKKSFQEEYRAFLKLHRIAFDERYAWN